MSNSQRPKPALPQFEVPDLELVGPQRAVKTRRAEHTPSPSPHPYHPGAGFLDDTFDGEPLSIELDDGAPRALPQFGAGASIDTLGDMELEGNAPPDPSADPDKNAWPSGRAPDRARLVIDPLQVALLANYGEPNASAHLSPLYAYRVFTRQRELKRALAPLEAERQRAEAERDDALADVASAVRPEAERIEAFRRFFAPIIESEQLAGQRSRALATVNNERESQTATLVEELSALAVQLDQEQTQLQQAQHGCDETEAVAKRVEAKLKRVQIEIRGVTQVAEQKLGPRGGEIPASEAAQLHALRQLAEAAQAEADQAMALFRQAELQLERAAARVTAAQQRERHAGRKKQALAEHYLVELASRSRGVSESEERQRAALADLGRALLAARGSVLIPETSLDRVRASSQKADGLFLRCEMQLRALDAYDRDRVRKGVRLACTAVALFVLLLTLKLVL